MKRYNAFELSRNPPRVRMRGSSPRRLRWFEALSLGDMTSVRRILERLLPLRYIYSEAVDRPLVRCDHHSCECWIPAPYESVSQRVIFRRDCGINQRAGTSRLM